MGLGAFYYPRTTKCGFSKTNSKDGLEDMVLTISDNLMPSWRKGHTLKVTDSAGNNVSKDFEKLTFILIHFSLSLKIIFQKL